MKSVKLDSERGQVLIMVAVMVVVLFGFVGLAVDGGNIYAGRRRMQNASDAGALAGAREICFGNYGDLGDAHAAAEDVALDYAIDRNSAQTATVTISDDYTVTVNAGQTLNTFFAGALGIQNADVGARATAACGKVTTVCNVWPIAFDTTTFSSTQCGEHILLWTDDMDAPDDCGGYICDCPEPGQTIDDLESLTQVSDGRGWLDFSAVIPGGYEDECDNTGGGASELVARIVGETNQGDECTSFIELDSCAAGSAGSGVVNSAWSAAGTQIGEVKYIPLYDPSQSSPDNPCTMDHDPGANVGSLRYYLVDVACVEVVSVCRLCDGSENPNQPCGGPRVIEVKIVCDDERCSAGCGTTFGGRPGPGDVKAVNLLH